MEDLLTEQFFFHFFAFVQDDPYYALKYFTKFSKYFKNTSHVGVSGIKNIIIINAGIENIAQAILEERQSGKNIQIKVNMRRATPLKNKIF